MAIQHDCIFDRNLHSIFRSSSLASCIIEESLRLVGKSYLCKVLSEEVERVKVEGRTCEVDPARLSLSNGVLPQRSTDSPAMNNESLASNKVSQPSRFYLLTCILYKN